MAGLVISDAAYRPINRWDHHRIQPGPVHSVGDAITGVKFKHSHPDLPIRWDPEFKGAKSTLMGDNNSDGNHEGYFNDGMGDPMVKDSNWPSYRDFKVAVGWVQQDLRPPDKTGQPLLQSTPNSKWDLKVANTYNVLRPGFHFLPLPGGYGPSVGDLPRGGNVPAVTNVISPDHDVINFKNQLALLGAEQMNALNEMVGTILPQPGRRFFARRNVRGPNKG